MKTKLFLLTVIFALGVSACFPINQTTPTTAPTAEVTSEPTLPPTAESPTEEPQPTPEPTLEPTPEVTTPVSNLYAYSKEGEVFVFTPEDMSVVRMGDSNHPFGYGSDCLLYQPRLSMDGHYLAFEAHCSNSFIVYDLIANAKIAEIDKVSDPQILGDTLLAWAENGRLYFTRMVGGCSFDPELKGPDRIEVYSYDPSAGGTRYEFDLPKVNDAPHAYSIGITMDPEAEHVIGWNAACSVGLGSRFLLTTATGDYVIDPPTWPASFGDLGGQISDFGGEQYIFGADGGKLFVLKDPTLEWDPNARLMFLAAGASDAQQIDSGSFNELVSQAPLLN